MTLNLTPPPTSHVELTPRITVIGVGGGGTNAVNNMILAELKGVEFVVANTDAQQLAYSRAERRIQLGPHLTRGLGAGAKPEIGREAAEEAAEEIGRHLEGANLVFITAGMGGGTGTGAAPVIARMARERGVLTVGVVSKPFQFEGRRRASAAEQGISELQKHVDTLIVIPNQNLFSTANQHTTFKEAFKMADDVLRTGVGGITDLMVSPGLINLDFADVKAVMEEMGKAMMGTGEAETEAEGEERAIIAAERAISNPLLEETSMAGARGLIINITGGEDLTLYEVNAAAERIRDEVSEEANIIFGALIDEKLNGRIRVSVVATGIDSIPPVSESVPAEAVSTQPNAAPSPQSAGASRPASPSFQPGSTYAGGSRPNFQIDPHAPTQPLAPEHAHPQSGNQPSTSSSAQVQPQGPSPRSGLFSEGQRPPAQEPPRSLFGLVTGAFRSRPNQNEQTQQRTEPSQSQGPASLYGNSGNNSGQAQPPHGESTQHNRPAGEASSETGSHQSGPRAPESDLDIPAFLRR